MKKLAALIGAALLAIGVGTGHAAEKDNTGNLPQNFEHVFDGDIAFTKGGLWSRFLVIEEWSNPAPILPFETGTIVQHNDHVWIALSTPAADDEPGTAAVWLQVTGGGSGTGATITAGTADPTGGSAGDAYIQVDASDNVQSIWRNAAGTWTEYTIPTAQAGTGDITAVGTTAPLTGGGTAGDVTVAIRAASPTQSGSMSAADKAKLDGVAANATANDGDVTGITASAPLTGGGASGDLTIALPDATTTAAGAMSSADKTKLDGIAAGATANTGDITEVGTTAPITGGGTAGSVTIAIRAATATLSGSMSAADKAKLDGLERQIELIDSLNDVTYTQADTTDLSSRFGGATVYTAELDAEGTDDAEINDLIVFQWRDNPAGLPGDRPLGIRYQRHRADAADPRCRPDHELPGQQGGRGPDALRVPVPEPPGRRFHPALRPPPL